MFRDQYLLSVRVKPEISQQHGYPFSLPIVRNLIHHGELSFDSQVTFFVGENGTGKSTLLEAIAVAFGFNPEGGTRNFSFSTKETHSGLFQYLTLSKGIHRAKDGFFLRAESFYNVASEIDSLNEMDGQMFSFYGGKSLHQYSHGESFLTLVKERFGENGLYILDEPEAALSPTGQFAFLSAMANLVKKNSQFLIATHSPILLCFPESVIYQLSDSGMEQVSYDQTEHYQLTRRFLENPEGMLKLLLHTDEKSD